MAITGITNLAELSSNQSPGQSQDTPVVTQATQAQAVPAAAPNGDSFEPSTQTNSIQATAQDAGLFNVSQFALASATADVLSAQTAAPQVAQDPPAAPAVQTPTAGTATAPAATVQDLQTIAAAPAPATQAPASAATTPAPTTQNELQSSNAELLDLGLGSGAVRK